MAATSPGTAFPAMPAAAQSCQAAAGPSLTISRPATEPLDAQQMPRLLRGTLSRATASWMAELTSPGLLKRALCSCGERASVPMARIMSMCVRCGAMT